MTDNSNKQWFTTSIDSFANQKANDRHQLEGKQLPCHVTKVTGQLVTVAFDVTGPFTMPEVTMPIATSNYDWLPVQVGDRGAALASDAYLGGVSGIGGGTANLAQRGNLSALWFSPVTNKAWQPPGGDATKRIVQGPGGARIQDIGGRSVIDVKSDGSIVITTTMPVTVNGAQITPDGNVISAAGINLNTHVHSGVTAGGDDTGPPV